MSSPNAEPGPATPPQLVMEYIPLWSFIEQNPSNIEKLHLLCNSDKERKKEGYILADLTDKEMSCKARCKVCYARRRKNRRSAKKSKPASTKVEKSVSEKHANELPASSITQTTNAVPATSASPPKAVCHSHPGIVLRPSKIWTCCQKPATERGCVSQEAHDYEDEHSESLRANWQFHHTPSTPTSTTFDVSTTNSPTNHRTAIAFDVEMGIALNGDFELIRVTAIDFFTQEILIDSLVKPNVKLQHYNTIYSGVTAADMDLAVARKTCYFGRDAARDAVYQFVGPETVIVAHGGNSDLNALRMIHPKVVDTLILEGYHGVKTPGGRTLKNLVKVKKGIEIQTGFGHDSLEDSLAARELVGVFLGMIPDE